MSVVENEKKTDLSMPQSTNSPDSTSTEQEENPIQENKKSKIVAILIKCLWSIVLIIEWVIGITLAKIPSEYYNDSYYRDFLGKQFEEQLHTTIFIVLGIIIVNIVTVLLVKHIVNRINKIKSKNKLAITIKDWSTKNVSAIKSIISWSLVVLEWVFTLSKTGISITAVLWVLFANIITIILILLLSSKAAKEKFKKSLEKVKEWCLAHKGWMVAICVFVVAIFVINSIDFESIRLKRSELRIEKSIKSGNPDEVMNAVKESADFEHPIYLLTQLVESENIDAAVYFYNYKTSHCSTKEMKSNYKNDAEFTRAACLLLYNALIQNEQMEKAWNYHQLDDEDPNASSNAKCYYQYLNDVVMYYCGKDNKQAAQQFVKQHIIWFVKYVDNEEFGQKNPEYQSANIKQQLLEQIESY